jgi:hypothetical protein
MYLFKLPIYPLFIFFSFIALEGMEKKEETVRSVQLSDVAKYFFNFLKKSAENIEGGQFSKPATGIRVVLECAKNPEQEVQLLFELMRNKLQPYGVNFKSDLSGTKYTVTIPNKYYISCVNNYITQYYPHLRRNTKVYIAPLKDGNKNSLMLMAEFVQSTSARL